MFLDQITFQNKRLQFRICHNIFKAADMCYHLFDLNPFIPAALKILPHTVFQADCFSDIDNLIRLIMHQIDSRPSRKLFQFFLYIKIIIFHRSYFLPLLQTSYVLLQFWKHHHTRVFLSPLHILMLSSHERFHILSALRLFSA